MLLGEVGKLREERRNVQLLVIAISCSVQLFTYEFPSEIGTLLSLRSKYEPGGMFDPDWWVYPFVT
jgi:hypothetical protein